MPVYEYECEECHQKFEDTLSVDDRDIHVGLPCSCGIGAYKRNIGNSGGFRLGNKGRVSWADGGYGDTYGDIENFKAGYKKYPKG